MISAEGLGYEQVVPALSKVLPTALHCGRPTGRAEVSLTFELVVGCDGLIRSIEATDPDDVPPEWLDCVSSVISKADFPAHDMPDGMPVTYPVNVSW